MRKSLTKHFWKIEVWAVQKYVHLYHIFSLLVFHFQLRFFSPKDAYMYILLISSRAFQRIFTCNIWRRYSRERASLSLKKWINHSIHSLPRPRARRGRGARNSRRAPRKASCRPWRRWRALPGRGGPERPTQRGGPWAARRTRVERFDRRGTEPFEPFRTIRTIRILSK